jgi:PTS system cellobiose-specific IIC component
LVPSLFGVTEPFNFGLPLVLNPYLMIPQLLIPIVNVVLLIVLMSIGIMPYAHAVYVWGVPVFFSGFMQAGVAGILFQAVVIVLDYFIALPFFKAYEKSVQTEE